jgi:threonine synthase
MAQTPVTIDDIRRAAQLLEGQIVRTPCTRSRVLSKITGAEVWLKFENFQFTASFKERGALNKLANLSDAERAAGVATMSAGNHAQGVAYHATRLGIRSVIVMPKNTPFTKVRNTRELGGEVILHGETLADAQAYLEAELVGRRGMTLVHPYDDPAIIAGQGTVALEMLERRDWTRWSCRSAAAASFPVSRSPRTRSSRGCRWSASSPPATRRRTRRCRTIRRSPRAGRRSPRASRSRTSGGSRSRSFASTSPS